MLGRSDVAVLVDVDKTLVVGSPTGEVINADLIEALKANKITSVYLFTNMSLNKLPDKITNPKFISRPNVIEALEKAGISVLEVISPADVTYDTESKRLGSAYREIYLPQYDRYRERELTEETYYGDSGFQTSRNRYNDFNAETETLATRADTSIKKLMYDLFLQSCSGLQLILIIDDNEAQIKPILEGAKGSPLKTRWIEAIEGKTADAYKSEIKKALEVVRQSSILSFFNGRKSPQLATAVEYSSSSSDESSSNQSSPSSSAASSRATSQSTSPFSSILRRSSKSNKKPMSPVIKEESSDEDYSESAGAGRSLSSTPSE